MINLSDEEAEEASEDKDSLDSRNEDSFTIAKPNDTQTQPTKPSRTIDLGAAANYGKSQTGTTAVTPSTASSSSISASTAPAPATRAAPVVSSAASDFFDLFSEPISQPSFQAPASAAQAVDLFSDFQSAPVSNSAAQSAFGTGRYTF